MTSSHNRRRPSPPRSPPRKPPRHTPNHPSAHAPPVARPRAVAPPHASSPSPTTPPLPPPSPPARRNATPPSSASPTTPPLPLPLPPPPPPSRVLPAPPPRVLPPPPSVPRARSRPSHHRANPHTDPVLPAGTRVRITGNNRTKWDLIGRHGTVLSAQTLGGWHEVSLTDGGIVRVQRNALHVLKFPNRHTPPLPPRTPIAKAQANISKLNVASLRRYRSVYNLDVANDCSKDELVGAVKKHFEKAKVNESEVISSFLRQIARRGASPAGAE